MGTHIPAGRPLQNSDPRAHIYMVTRLLVYTYNGQGWYAYQRILPARVPCAEPRSHSDKDINVGNVWVTDLGVRTSK